MASDFLQIVIPTYNRTAVLPETLNYLVQSIRMHQLMSKVRIVVLDNASTDSTPEIEIKAFADCRIQYIRNSYNIGLEKNVYKALTLDGARWTWVFGDDDVISRNAIGVTLSHLESLDDECKLVLLNYGQFAHDLKKLLSTHVCVIPQNFIGNWTGTNGLIKYKGIFDLLSFISSVIIRSDCAKELPDFTHISSLYDHTASLLCATKSSKISVLPPGIMYQRQNNQRQYGTTDTGNGKPGFQTFISLILLFNEVVRQNQEFNGNLFEYMTSKLGINEPQGDQSYISTYIWFFEVFAKPSLLNAKLPQEKTRICDAIFRVINIIHSESARIYISQQLSKFTA
jgi:glycosyltransferase involved in cell wall biosynthesis